MAAIGDAKRNTGEDSSRASTPSRSQTESKMKFFF